MSNPTVDEELDIRRYANAIRDADTLNEAEMRLRHIVTAAQTELLDNFVNWFNRKYDTGYDTGIAKERVGEYLAHRTKLTGEDKDNE